jgi:predicted transcriptional regulator of viral defense system
MEQLFKHTVDYIFDLKARGKYAFSLDDLNKFVSKSSRNINKDLDRLRLKGTVMNIRKGFYIIMPDQYQNMGILPAELFADDLMKFIGRSYYVGLYSAAMIHGAAHQQPQEFFIVNSSPNLRKIEKDHLIINFMEKKTFPGYGIEEKKTDTGFMKISGKELTFFDMIYYEKSLGGLDRVISVLMELAAGMKKSSFRKVLNNPLPVTVLQRAGYMLDSIIHNYGLAELVKARLTGMNPRTTLLDTIESDFGTIDEKWKVRVNASIEGDL